LLLLVLDYCIQGIFENIIVLATDDVLQLPPKVRFPSFFKFIFQRNGRRIIKIENTCFVFKAFIEGGASGELSDGLPFLR
jgi:hypothetical protein